MTDESLYNINDMDEGVRLRLESIYQIARSDEEAEESGRPRHLDPKVVEAYFRYGVAVTRGEGAYPRDAVMIAVLSGVDWPMPGPQTLADQILANAFPKNQQLFEINWGPKGKLPCSFIRVMDRDRGTVKIRLDGATHEVKAERLQLIDQGA